MHCFPKFVFILKFVKSGASAVSGLGLQKVQIRADASTAGLSKLNQTAKV